MPPRNISSTGSDNETSETLQGCSSSHSGRLTDSLKDVASTPLGNAPGIRGQAAHRRQADRRLPGEPVSPNYSRRVIQKSIDAETVLVNGRPVKASYRVRARRPGQRPAARDARHDAGARGHPHRGRLRRRGAHRGEQAAGDGHAPGQGELERDAGQRDPVPLRHALDAGRREPSRDRPPPRPRYHRPAGRRSRTTWPTDGWRSSSSCGRSTRSTSRWCTASRSATAITSSGRSASIRQSARRWRSARPRTAARPR